MPWKAERIERLQELTAALSEAATPADVARVLIAQGMNVLGAQTAGLWLFDCDGGDLRLVQYEGYSPDTIHRYARISMANVNPLCECIRLGKSMWIESQQEFEARYPDIAKSAPRPDSAFGCLPLTAKSGPLGGLSFTFPAPRPFTADERNFIEAITQLGAQALERSRLLEAEQTARSEANRARQRLSFLAAASGALAESLDYERTLASVARLAVGEMAELCAVIVDEDGELRAAAIAHREPDKEEAARTAFERFGLDESRPHPTLRVLRSGRAELMAEVPPDLAGGVGLSEEHRALVERIAVRSVIIAPLCARGKTQGVIVLARGAEAPAYEEADLSLANELALRAAVAIDNARLYEERELVVAREREARQLREEMLSVVSHDLKSPLGVITMAAYRLEHLPAGEPKQVMKLGSRIARAAEQMERLIGDLLDLATLQAGRLTLQIREYDLGQLVADCADALSPLAQAKSLQLGADGPPTPIRLSCDGNRISRVLSNLLSNAIKFTPAGGIVSVRVTTSNGEVIIAVADTGRGIADDDVPRVFDRFWRVDDDERGTGLGLAIAKGIVEAHGGRIWCESALGHGSMFAFSLPMNGRPAHHA